MNKPNPPPACPIDERRIDDYAARTGAALIILIAIIAWMFNYWFVMLLLSFDFLLRSGGLFQYNPIVKVARITNAMAEIPTKSTVAKPKQFAAGIGALFCLGIAFGLYFRLPTLVSSVNLALLPCAFLEASIGYWVGCKVYTAIRLLRGK